MTEYDNSSSGAVWAKRDGAAENAPDFKIDWNFRGEDLSIAIWRRRQTDNQNGPSYKFRIEDKTEVHNTGHAQAKAALAGDDETPNDDPLESDVPF
jgi:hypothetical protein